jgi:hypothetical protein
MKKEEMKKVCTKCKKEKSLDDFSNRKNCTGKVIKHSICRECLKLKVQKYRKENKEQCLLYDKNRYKKSQEFKKENSKNWYINNKNKRENWSKENSEKLKIYRKEYYKNNREKLLKQNREISDNRRLNDPLYKLKYNIRNMIGLALRKRGYTKRSKTQNILGCTFEEFKTYIEGKFENWMNWQNHGKYNGQLNFGWDIDHIIPLSSAKTENELTQLNHYTNLQPLCSKINRDIKRGK